MKATSALLCFSIFYTANLVIGDDTIKDEGILYKCKTEVGATDEDVELLRDKKLPTARSGFCLLTCIYEHNGFVKNGKFDIDTFINSSKPDDDSIGAQYFDEVAIACKDVQNDDKCFLAKDILMCAAETISKHLKGQHMEL